MNKDYLIQLTNNLYRLTLLFPKKEPLRYKMREVADEILANLISFSQDSPLQTNRTIVQNVSRLEVLDGFFEVAKNQNWVSPTEISNLQKEYSKLKASLNEISRGQPSAKLAEVRPRQTLNERQEKILEFLKKNGQSQVWQVKQVFPEVSKRTLRRDFEFLLKQGKIERIGERNETFYQLPTNYESKRITNNDRTMS